MPIDKDMYMIFETYARPATPNKVNHNHPSTLANVKNSTAATAGTDLDIKGQGSDIGLAGNTPVDVSEEDAEAINSNTPTPVKGRYIYFVENDELYQLKPYKQIQPTGMMMAMSDNWTKANVMQGEDVKNMIGKEVSDISKWYIVNGAPGDHTFVAYIGA
jgi:hypothetical protein